jgi:mannose-1-phosphate guanylyltransferase/mannose-6-phosphate isomerase
MKIQPVILCGGAGTRLWPLSREHYPKQLLALNGERTLLQETALRLGSLAGVRGEQVGDPLVVCNEQHRFLVSEQLRSCGARSGKFLLEPCGRGTAPALTLAAIDAVTADDPVLVAMPSDHVIARSAEFAKAVAQGADLAAAGYLVAFGVPPRSAETGYGYIRAGLQVGRSGGPDARFVDAFVEKPDAATAAHYLTCGGYLWNSGIFAVRASVWIECISALRKEIFSACERARRLATRDGAFVHVERIAFEACPADSVDYAVMENICRRAPGDASALAAVVPLEAGWSDVGAWGALWDIEAKDADGNVIHGDVQADDTRNALLIAQHRLLACIGLEDVVVIETPDAVMVAHRDKAQDVKAVVSRLREAGRPECLAHRKVRRPWGSYDSVDSGERFQVKRIMVDPGASLSLQMHYHRAEHWIVVKGTARVYRGEEVFLLTENHSTYIPMGVRHRLENPGRVPLEIIEVQSGAYLGEDDIVRFEDRYGRVEARAGAPA